MMTYRSNVFPLSKWDGIIPGGDHPGGFGYVRKNHIHEGVDLYANPGDQVYSISDGFVVSTYIFTGPDVGMPWWNTTYAVAIGDDTGVWVYGEIAQPALRVGDTVKAGDLIGALTPVLKIDKGAPMTMLHLERWKPYTAPYTFLWKLGDTQPNFLLDPTPLLRKL